MNDYTIPPADAVIVVCPRCQQKLRLPRSQRSLRVTCTACRHSFDHSPDHERAQIQTNVMIVGGVVAVLGLVLVLFCGGILVSMPGAGPPTAEQQRAQRIATLTAIMNQNRQQIFESLHPVGTALRVDVHEAELVTSPAGEPLLQIRYTIYWQGPLTRDGVTKVLQVVDLESNRPHRPEILATNGVTNAQATDLSLVFLEAFMQELIRQQQ